MSTHTDYLHDREFVRTFFTTPTAVEGEDDSAKMLRSAAQLRGMKAPDVWVPDNEDATAPSMREGGIQNIIEVLSEHGEDYPGEIHPRVVWHRDSPKTRYQGFQQIPEHASDIPLAVSPPSPVVRAESNRTRGFRDRFTVLCSFRPLQSPC